MSNNTIETWSRCLQKLKSKIQPQSFETWFKPILCTEVSELHVILQTPNSFFADWLEEHYSALILATIEEECGWSPLIRFEISTQETSPQVPIEFLENRHEEISDTQPVPANLDVPLSPVFPLNPKYRFDHYVVGDSNEIAYSAAQAVAENPGRTMFNPLVIYGGVGLGKTHLLQSIGDYCLRNKTAENVVCVTAEKFISDYIGSIRRNAGPEFDKVYRRADILLVDDIQFFVQTEGCQREFIHTFNTLYQNEKQIVISSDRPPSDLKGFEDRLISRFQWGLVADIELPNLETRIAILIQKAEEMHLELPDDVALFIADQVHSNIRELEGALKRLYAFSTMQSQQVNINLAQRCISNRKENIRSSISIQFIQETAAEFFDIPVDVLVGSTRRQKVANARHICMYLSKALTGEPLKSIGNEFGNRDHSTVIHACKNVKQKIASSPGYEETVSKLQNEIQGNLVA